MKKKQEKTAVLSDYRASFSASFEGLNIDDVIYLLVSVGVDSSAGKPLWSQLACLTEVAEQTFSIMKTGCLQRYTRIIGLAKLGVPEKIITDAFPIEAVRSLDNVAYAKKHAELITEVGVLGEFSCEETTENLRALSLLYNQGLQQAIQDTADDETGLARSRETSKVKLETVKQVYHCIEIFQKECQEFVDGLYASIARLVDPKLELDKDSSASADNCVNDLWNSIKEESYANPEVVLLIAASLIEDELWTRCNLDIINFDRKRVCSWQELLLDERSKNEVSKYQELLHEIISGGDSEESEISKAFDKDASDFCNRNLGRDHVAKQTMKFYSTCFRIEEMAVAAFCESEEAPRKEGKKYFFYPGNAPKVYELANGIFCRDSEKNEGFSIPLFDWEKLTLKRDSLSLDNSSSLLEINDEKNSYYSAGYILRWLKSSFFGNPAAGVSSIINANDDLAAEVSSIIDADDIDDQDGLEGRMSGIKRSNSCPPPGEYCFLTVGNGEKIKVSVPEKVFKKLTNYYLYIWKTEKELASSPGDPISALLTVKGGL